MLDIIGVGDTNVDVMIRVPRIASHDEKVRGQLLGNFRLFGFVGYFDLPLELHLRHTRVFVQFLLNCLLLFPGERTRQLFLRRILKVIGKRQLAALFHIEVNVSVQSTRSTEA